MPTLGLTMIVRNESRCLQRCLQSARDLVDFITVCDTGSTDNSVEIAESLGARVVHRPWTGDFSAARNFSLSCSPADWNLVLDADEWIDESVQSSDLHSFIAGTPRVGLIRIRSEFELHGRVEHSDTWIPRLFPRDIRYEGRIHEQPVHNLPAVRLRVLVNHDGYQPERTRSKRDRNMELLKAELQQHPLQAYLHFQMGVQHEADEEWEGARTWYAQALENGALKQPFAHDLAVRYLHVLARCAHLEEALNWASEIEIRWPNSSDVLFAIGNLCLDLAAFDEANALKSWLPSAQAAWMRCIEIGEHGEGDSHVVGRGSFLAAHNLAVIYAELGEKDLAAKFQALAQRRPTFWTACVDGT